MKQLYHVHLHSQSVQMIVRKDANLVEVRTHGVAKVNDNGDLIFAGENIDKAFAAGTWDRLELIECGIEEEK